MCVCCVSSRVPSPTIISCPCHLRFCCIVVEQFTCELPQHSWPRDLLVCWPTSLLSTDTSSCLFLSPRCLRLLLPLGFVSRESHNGEFLPYIIFIYFTFFQNSFHIFLLIYDSRCCICMRVSIKLFMQVRSWPYSLTCVRAHSFVLLLYLICLSRILSMIKIYADITKCVSHNRQRV